MEIPDDRYYGIQTSRMVKVSGCAHLPIIFYPGMHRALFRIKKACALANAEIGALKPEISRAVVEACDPRARGRIRQEISARHVAGRRLHLRQHERERSDRQCRQRNPHGSQGQDAVHPNTHVNKAQSTNDTLRPPRTLP